MEVILKEDVETLGQRGDVVKVANGYGRNYLLPKRLAIEATSSNRAVIVQMKESSIRKSAKEKTSAQALSTSMEAVELTFERKVGANDTLFGSVTSADIAAELLKHGFEMDRRKIALEEPLKQLGEFHVPVKLHREVTTHLKVTVKSDDPNYVPGQHAALEADDTEAVRGKADYHDYDR